MQQKIFIVKLQLCSESEYLHMFKGQKSSVWNVGNTGFSRFRRNNRHCIIQQL